MATSATIVCWLSLMLEIAFGLRSPLNQPNFVIFLADDMGYGDLSSYGHPTQEFGPIDQMGREGMRFTQWYTAAPFCTPSRGAMLTGRYPVRIGLYGDQYFLFPVFMPHSVHGLPKDEITIAEALGDLGYSTGMVGKWHLGINEFSGTDGNHLPMHHGFEFVGTNLPFSNIWRCDEEQLMISSPSVTDCFLYYNDTIQQQPFSHHNLTSALVLDAKAFVYNHQHEPFFLYFSLPHTHSNMFSSASFRGSSRRGRYGDNMNEMGWAVGEMLQLLKELSLEKNTLTVFLSDNGPERELCKEGGTALPLKGWKGHTWDGGTRVPAITWWPGTIQADVTNHEFASSMDLFSTLIDLGGGTLPTDRVIDGKSLKAVLLDAAAKSPHESFYHYAGKQLMAVRYGKYKAHYRTQEVLNATALSEFCGPTDIPQLKGDYHCADASGPCVTHHDPPLLYDTEQDPGEEYPLDPSLYSDVLAKIDQLRTNHNDRVVFGRPLFNDYHSSHTPCCNPPYCWCNYLRQM